MQPEPPATEASRLPAGLGDRLYDEATRPYDEATRPYDEATRRHDETRPPDDTVMVHEDGVGSEVGLDGASAAVGMVADLELASAGSLTTVGADSALKELPFLEPVAPDLRQPLRRPTAPEAGSAAGPGSVPDPDTAPDPEAEPGRQSSPTRAGRLVALVRSWPAWLVHPVLIYLASRVLTWATLAVTSIFTHVGIGGEIDRWDTRWFIRAAQFGWPSQLPHRNGHVAANTIAFLPAFPLSFRWLAHLTGLSLLTAGSIVTSVSGLTAMIGVWLLIRAYADQNAADRGTLLVAMFPGSFVLSLVYSEGFVLTFVSFGLLALLRRRWLLAGLLGALATATTPIALAFEISCLWCAYREVKSSRNWRSLLAPVLTPVGFFAYQVWLWIHTGNVSAWRLTERGGWKSYPSLAYAAHTVGVVLKDPIATNKTDDLLFVGTVLTVFAAVIAIRSRLPMPVLLYGLVAAGIAFVSAPVGLRPRFMFLAFPLIIAVGTWLRGRTYLWVVSISMALLVFATAYEVSSWAVFP